MKTTIKTLALSALVAFSATSIAEQAPQPSASSADKAGKAMQHEMAGMDHGNKPEQLKEMQAHTLMMHDLSNKILAETDPTKQQALKDQQLELMKAHHAQMMSAHHKDMHHGKGGMEPGKLGEHLKQKQEHMLMMHDLNNKILAEADPAKQQALKDQQLELMKAHHAQMMSMHPDKPMEHKPK